MRRVQIKSGDFDTMGYDWSVSSCITLRGDQCITPRPSGEAWWCEHPAVAYHCRSLATVRQPKSLRLPALKCEKHFKTQYMGKYVGVIRKAYRTYMCKFGKYWDIGINVLNMIQYGI